MIIHFLSEDPEGNKVRSLHFTQLSLSYHMSLEVSRGADETRLRPDEHNVGLRPPCRTRAHTLVYVCNYVCITLKTPRSELISRCDGRSGKSAFLEPLLVDVHELCSSRPRGRCSNGGGRVDHTLAGRKDFADSHRVSNRELVRDERLSSNSSLAGLPCVYKIGRWLSTKGIISEQY